MTCSPAGWPRRPGRRRRGLCRRRLGLGRPGEPPCPCRVSTSRRAGPPRRPARAFCAACSWVPRSRWRGWPWAACWGGEPADALGRDGGSRAGRPRPGRRRPRQRPDEAGRPADSAAMTAHIRIGIDTGGTFTDVVAFDEATGELTVTKTPSTPADPAEGFMAGLEKMLALLGTRMDAVASVSHGTTIATNQLLEGDVGRLGFITSEGFEFILEIARQSVPDGYGNSYFWVKPDRIVPPDLVKTVGGRMDHAGAEMRPFDEAQAVRGARWFGDRGVDTIGGCLLHSEANPEHEERIAAVLARERPRAVVSLSSRV